MICEFSGNPGERPGLWKLFLWNEVARAKLISEGIDLDGIAIEIFSNNPMKKINEAGEEICETKVTISNVPPSFDDEEIVTTLRKRGVNVTSKIRMDYIRNPDGKLSTKESGRRTVWIEIPERPLPKVLQVGPIKVKVYHKEMKRCDNCLQTGHDKRNCNNKIVCRFCQKEGHKISECAEYLKNRSDEQAQIESEITRIRQEESKRQEEDEKKKQRDEENKKQEEEENKKLEEELRQIKENKERKHHEEEERKKLEDEKKEQKEEELKKQKEEENKAQEEEGINEDEEKRQRDEKDLTIQGKELERLFEEKDEEEMEVSQRPENESEKEEDKEKNKESTEKAPESNDQAENEQVTEVYDDTEEEIIKKEEERMKKERYLMQSKKRESSHLLVDDREEGEIEEETQNTEYVTSEYFGEGQARITRPLERCRTLAVRNSRSPSIKRKHEKEAGKKGLGPENKKPNFSKYFKK